MIIAYLAANVLFAFFAPIPLGLAGPVNLAHLTAMSKFAQGHL